MGAWWRNIYVIDDCDFKTQSKNIRYKVVFGTKSGVYASLVFSFAIQNQKLHSNLIKATT